MIVEQNKHGSGAPPQDEPPVSLVVEYDGAEDLLMDHAENLSSGKVFLNSPRQLDAGTRVLLKLTFPGLLQPILVRGTVGWTRTGPDVRESDRGIGIEIDEAAKQKLEQTIERVRERDPDLVVARLLRILVVEDNPHVAQLIRNGLHGTGRREFNDNLAFNFRTASNGREALNLLDSEPFDALIVDVYLPILDGAHVIAQVRASKELRGLPVIAVSAGGHAAQVSALEAGADIFLEKPMRLRQIVNAIRDILDLGG